jgi:hypothetical protein
VELVEQRIEVVLRARLRLFLDHFQNGADVVLDRQAAKDRGFLRQVADAEPGAAVHRHRAVTSKPSISIVPWSTGTSPVTM